MITQYTLDGEKQGRGEMILWVPFVAGVEKLQRVLKNELDVEMAFKRGNTIGRTLSRLKRPKGPAERRGIVYSIGCKDCDKEYIGESQRTLDKRRSEHMKCCETGDETNGIYMHTRNTKHRIDWLNAKVIGLEANSSRRKKLESIHIKAQDSTRELDNLMNLESGVSIHPSWNFTLKSVRDQRLQHKIDGPSDECWQHNLKDSKVPDPIPICSLINL